MAKQPTDPRRDESTCDQSTRDQSTRDQGARNEGARDDSNTIKDPADWTTGDEPMTGAQRSYLHTLASEAKEEVPDDLTKAEASERIDALQERTGRGKGGASTANTAGGAGGADEGGTRAR